MNIDKTNLAAPDREFPVWIESHGEVPKEDRMIFVFRARSCRESMAIEQQWEKIRGIKGAEETAKAVIELVRPYLLRIENFDGELNDIIDALSLADIGELAFNCINCEMVGPWQKKLSELPSQHGMEKSKASQRKQSRKGSTVHNAKAAATSEGRKKKRKKGAKNAMDGDTLS